MPRLIDYFTLRDYKQRVDQSTSELELLTARGDQLHVFLLGIVFTYCLGFTLSNLYFDKLPQAYITMVPIPLTVLFYYFFRLGGNWELVSKLSNLFLLLILLSILKMLDGPYNTGILTFFIPVIIGSMITFQGKQRPYAWFGISLSLTLLGFLTFYKFEFFVVQEMPEAMVRLERIQNYIGSALATTFEVGFLIWVSNELQGKLIQKEQEKQQLITRMNLQTQEHQRNEVAIELHENINQILASAKLNLNGIPSDVGLSEKIRDSEQQIDYALVQIRKLYQILVTPDLHEFELTDLIREMVDDLFREEDVRIVFDSRLDVSHPISEDVKLSLYRIAQEHLMNIRQHASAGRLQIRLADQHQRIFFSVEDDGVGFDPNKARIGLGIRSMENRVRLHNGSIQLDTTSGQGCRLQVELPFE